MDRGLVWPSKLSLLVYTFASYLFIAEMLKHTNRALDSVLSGVVRFLAITAFWIATWWYSSVTLAALSPPVPGQDALRPFA